MKQTDYQKLGQKIILAYLRQNNNLKTFIKILSTRFNMIQEIILYLLNSYKISNARGKWLDYIGSEVGAQREEIDYGNYFVVNQPHINVPKMFYFLTSENNPQNILTLEDASYIQKISTYIGTNISSGTIEDILTLVKKITEADMIEIRKSNSEGLSITVEGDHMVLTRNTESYVHEILSNGIYLKEIKNND